MPILPPSGFDDELCVLVRGIPFHAVEDDVLAKFKACGKVVKHKVPVWEDGGLCKGLAWVQFSKKLAAAKALKMDRSNFGEAAEDARFITVVKKGEFLAAQREALRARGKTATRSTPSSKKVRARAGGKNVLLRKKEKAEEAQVAKESKQAKRKRSEDDADQKKKKKKKTKSARGEDETESSLEAFLEKVAKTQVDVLEAEAQYEASDRTNEAALSFDPNPKTPGKNADMKKKKKTKKAL